MNSFVSKFLFYYPATLIKGEPVCFLEKGYYKSQYLTKAELEERQLRRLKKIMSFAIKKSEFYRNLYDRSGVSLSDLRSLSDLKKFPTINKKDVIENVDTMSTFNFSLFTSSKTTGGSTGQPVRLNKNPIALARERAATWRGYHWAGLASGDSQLRLWGVPHGDVNALKSLLVDVVANRKRISAFELTEENMFKYYQSALRFKPKFIYGYVSAIDEFASFIIRNDLPPIPTVKAIITTSEVLTNIARKNIEQAFSAKVFNEFGCGEVGSVAHECEEGKMHITADNLIVETDSEYGRSGELIVTDLFNKASPVIRYRLGDFGVLTDSVCSCGRVLPIIESIQGRAYDILIMPDGRKIHPESAIYVFEDIQKKVRAFEQFQVVQVSPMKLIVLIIPGSQYSSSIGSMILNGLKEYLYERLDVSIKLVERIPRESSGKMRVVKRDF